MLVYGICSDSEIDEIFWMKVFWHFQACYSTLCVLFGILVGLLLILELEGLDGELKSRELRLD
jgi:hypothetical protein